MPSERDDAHQSETRAIQGGIAVGVRYGLIGGLTEVAILGVRDVALKEPLPLSAHFVWMVPLLSVLYCAIVGVIAVAAASLLPVRLQDRTRTFLMAFVATLSPLLALPRMHRGAVLLLAAGIAAQVARRRHMRTAHSSAKSIAVVAGLILVLAGGVTTAAKVREWRALAALQSATGAPNVVLIVLDTVRADGTSLYGYDKPTTPTLERLAKTGVVFRSAWATAPWTLPSHASMFTGRWPHELSADWRHPLDSTFPTLAEVLRKEGYVTAGFVANLLYGTADHGLDRGFIHYEDYPMSVGQVLLSSSLGSNVATARHIRRALDYHRPLTRKTAQDLTDDFLSWLSRHEKQSPFFAFLNYMDAHEPYLPPDSSRAKFGPPRIRNHFSYSRLDAFRPNKAQMSTAERAAERAAYDGSVAYVDAQFGRLLDSLAREHVLDRTLLLVTSDHGEQFGEHNLFEHGNSLYRSVLEVPLVLSMPGRIPRGAVITESVSLRDVPATVVDLIGEKGGLFPGSSLSRFWLDRNKDGSSSAGVLSELLYERRPPRFAVQPADAHKSDMRSWVRGGFHFIQKEDDEELFDVRNDPEEARNLVDVVDYRSLVSELRRELEGVIKPPQQN